MYLCIALFNKRAITSSLLKLMNTRGLEQQGSGSGTNGEEGESGGQTLGEEVGLTERGVSGDAISSEQRRGFLWSVSHDFSHDIVRGRKTHAEPTAEVAELRAPPAPEVTVLPTPAAPEVTELTTPPAPEVTVEAAPAAPEVTVLMTPPAPLVTVEATPVATDSTADFFSKTEVSVGSDFASERFRDSQYQR